MSEELIGTAVLIRFKDRPDGWSPGTLRAEGAGKRGHNVVGKWQGTAQGSKVRLTGKWNHDPKWGAQFAFDSIEVLEVCGIEEVRLFLEYRLPGVGPVRSQAIMAMFGENALAVIAEEPERLAKVRGITEDMAKDIHEAYKVYAYELEVAKALRRWHLEPHIQQRCMRQWHKRAVEKLEEDPFNLYYEIDGAGFPTADKAREAAGLAETDLRRVKAMLVFVIEDKAESEGSTCMSEVEMLNMAMMKLGVGPGVISEALDAMVKAGKLVRRPLRGETVIYRAPTEAHEAQVARTVLALLGQRGKAQQAPAGPVDSAEVTGSEDEDEVAGSSIPPEAALRFALDDANGKSPCARCTDAHEADHTYLMPCCSNRVCVPCFDGAGAMRARKGKPMSAPCPVCRRFVEVAFEAGEQLWTVKGIADA